MILDEVFTGKQLSDVLVKYDDDLDVYQNKIGKQLKKLGWTEIARGHYGSVFFNPVECFVIKITQELDSAYENFLQLAKSNPNPSWPKIYKDFVVETKDRKYYVYFIEHLRPLQNVKLFSEINDYTMYLNLKYTKEPVYEEQRKYLARFEKKYPRLAKAIELLFDYVEGDDVHQTQLDLNNPHNVMQRMGGQVVIIDPFIDATAFYED